MHSTVTPSRFKRELCKVKPSFDNQLPQDAHELLLTLLTELSGSEMDRDKGAVEQLSWGFLGSKMKCSSCLQEYQTDGAVSNCISLELFG